jgi:hypothetical protein
MSSTSTMTMLGVRFWDCGGGAIVALSALSLEQPDTRNPLTAHATPDMSRAPRAARRIDPSSECVNINGCPCVEELAESVADSS